MINFEQIHPTAYVFLRRKCTFLAILWQASSAIRKTSIHMIHDTQQLDDNNTQYLENRFTADEEKWIAADQLNTVHVRQNATEK